MQNTRDSVFIIAEAGVNHDGDLAKALELIDVAADAGADAVKFQTFRASHVASRLATKANYQRSMTDAGESQLEMLQKLELGPDAFRTLAAHSARRKVEFLSTPFDLESVSLLREIGVKNFKVGSGDLTNAPLLRSLGRSGLPTFISTGMASLGEIEAALAIFSMGALEREGEAFDPTIPVPLHAHSLLAFRVVLLHCTTEYPAPIEETNLRAMDVLHSAFGLPVGFSDHTKGSEAALAAVARGASVLEKHLTLDKTASGPDHAASLEPDELSNLVRSVRNVEAALGSGRKGPTASEVPNIQVARKSLVAASPIRRGDRFTEVNLTTKRPGNGISALRYYDWIGRIARRDYATDDLIEE